MAMGWKNLNIEFYPNKFRQQNEDILFQYSYYDSLAKNKPKIKDKQMRIKILASFLMTVWVTTASAYGWEDGDPLISSGDEAAVEYKPTCDVQRQRAPSMTDEEYSDFLLEFQDSECAHVFKVGDIGFGGGRVFYTTDEGRHGLETAPTDIKPLEWGCYDQSLEGAKDLKIGSGSDNTEAIIDESCKSYFGGSVIFDDIEDYNGGGFRDWYVPSAYELYKIYEVQGSHKVVGDSTQFSYPQYFWSSSEINSRYIYAQNLDTGSKVYAERGLTLSTLPIRSF
ncbi:hypothetical protein BPLS_P2228 [Bathymodiolus platifrons methanotrophic gill symbiont]|nr:hypothetical protein [Bathymodiolus platifrons methanotrophic gill symbiont]GFO75174.1 hypothetical protein BPLS_P2228 [Bathymodiolus platifrons methanotrophic gill symbiont]